MLRIAPLLLAIALAAADRPTDEEWAPVAQAIAGNVADAPAQVAAITARFPKWPDGHRALALVQLRTGDAKGAYKSARVALQLNKADAEAGALAVQALAAQDRVKDAQTIANLFTDQTDVGGRVAAQAAVACLQVNDLDNCLKYLDASRKRAGEKVDATVEFVTGRLLVLKRDLPGAAAALDRALTARPDYRDALYERGRLRLVLARQEPAKADEPLNGALADFETAVRLDRRDAPALMGWGRALIDSGVHKIANGKSEDGNADLRLSASKLRDALDLDPESRDGHLWLGDACLRLEQWAEAVPHLRKARAGGASDHALPFNLALALGKSGQAEEAQKILSRIEPEGLDEILTVGLNAYRLGDYNTAKKHLTEALSQLDPNDGNNKTVVRYAQTLRWIAHCERELALQFPAGDRTREELLDGAAKRMKYAGDMGDFESRHWWAAMQAPRNPELAFQVGKQLLKWDGYWNPPAWKLLVGNYGHHITGGEGLAGTLRRGPAHLMLWALLALLPLGFFLKSLLMPAKAADPAPAPKKDSTRRSARPQAVAARKPPTSVTVKPATPKPPAKPGAPAPKTPFGG